MTRREVRQFEMLVRVRDFGTAQATPFPEWTLANESFAAIEDAVQHVGQYTGSKVMSTRGSTRRKALARAALLDALGAVSRTARGIAATDPAFQNKFQLPRRRPAPVLVTLARSFAQHAEAFAPLFVKRGFAATFIADLNARADAYESAIRARAESKQESSEAHARVQAALDAGLAAVQQLDLVVANHLREDEGLRARWTQTRHVGYRKYAKPTTTPAADVPAPVTTMSRIPPTPFTLSTPPIEGEALIREAEAA